MGKRGISFPSFLSHLHIYGKNEIVIAFVDSKNVDGTGVRVPRGGYSDRLNNPM